MQFRCFSGASIDFMYFSLILSKNFVLTCGYQQFANISDLHKNAEPGPIINENNPDCHFPLSLPINRLAEATVQVCS